MGAALLDPASAIDEVHAIVVVLLNASGNGQDVRVKDDVLGWEVELMHQNVVGTLADADLAVLVCCLLSQIKKHTSHDSSCEYRAGIRHRRRKSVKVRSSDTVSGEESSSCTNMS